MREVCGKGQNRSDQPDNGEDIKDRLAPSRQLPDLEPQLSHFLADIGKLGLCLRPEVGDLGPQLGDLGRRVRPSSVIWVVVCVRSSVIWVVVPARRPINSALVASSGSLEPRKPRISSMTGANRLSVAFTSARSVRIWATSDSSRATRASRPGGGVGPPVSVIGTGAQRMNVVERPVTAAETGRAGDRTLDIISGTVYRGLDVETLG